MKITATFEVDDKYPTEYLAFQAVRLSIDEAAGVKLVELDNGCGTRMSYGIKEDDLSR